MGFSIPSPILTCRNREDGRPEQDPRRRSEMNLKPGADAARRDLTAQDGRAMAFVTITVDADADIGKVRKILSDLAENHPKVLKLAGAAVTKLSAQGMTLYVSGWCANSEDAQQAEFDLYEEARRRFDEEKIGVH